MTPTIFAIDFGTSNSLLAAASPGRVFPPAPLDPLAPDPSVLRSALYFTSLDDGHFGADAVREFVRNGMRGRLIRSIKRHLPSRGFTTTRIGDRKVTLEEIVGAFLRAMRERACEHFGVDVRSAVLGRPARFSTSQRFTPNSRFARACGSDHDDDRLAQERLERAARIAGFDRVVFCPEPIAAAYDFAEDLEQSRLVLVADLGGGTSDFTVVRMSARRFRPDDVLAVGGVSTAGDAIDGALVRAAVAPHFGARARYRVVFGSNVLEMPRDLVEMLCSPADLTLVDRRAVLRRVADIRAGLVDSADRARLDRLATVVEDGVGFALYEAVEGAKRRLSREESTEIAFDYPTAELTTRATRSELEAAAQKAVDRIMGALDATLDTARVSASEIEIACLTGGTARMPMIERALRERLPRAQFRHLRSFHSVVQGLARRAAEIA